VCLFRPHSSLYVDAAATRYKDVMWTKIQPGASGVSFDTCGDQGEACHACVIPQFIHSFAHDALSEAKDVVTQLARSHGFTARDRSSLHLAIFLHFFFLLLRISAGVGLRLQRLWNQAGESDGTQPKSLFKHCGIVFVG